MSEKLVVGISDWKVCKSPDVLVTYALGSCIGTCLYDKTTGISGLSHIMLPDSKSITGGENTRAKFADTAIVDMLGKMKSMGASSNIVAKIAGGAVMFRTTNNKFNIGARNIEAVKKVLSALNIPIISEDTGLDYGRTVSFFAENGMMEVSASSKGKKLI